MAIGKENTFEGSEFKTQPIVSPVSPNLVQKQLLTSYHLGAENSHCGNEYAEFAIWRVQ